MEHILLEDQHERVVFSRIDPICKASCLNNCTDKAVKCVIDKKTKIRGKHSSLLGTVYLCTDEPEHIKSKRVFKRTIQFYTEMLGQFIDIKQSILKDSQAENDRLVHNLTTLNTHIIQEIYNIIPQESLTGGPNEQIEKLEDAIESKLNDSARAALKILKNAIAGRSEMQIVKHLRDTSTLQPNLKYHNLHKVTKNVLITFFQEFQEKSIQCTIGECHITVNCDYEFVSAALYRLFENAVKYCKESSELRIKYELKENNLHMIMQMESIPIQPQEIEKIFDEGYSGHFAKQKGISGNGLGLFYVRQMLNANGASISASSGSGHRTMSLEIFAENTFQIVFPSSTIKVPKL